MFFEYQGWLMSISHFNRAVRAILWHPLGHGSTQLKKKKKKKKKSTLRTQPSYFQFIICKHIAKRTRDLLFTFYFNILGW